MICCLYLTSTFDRDASVAWGAKAWVCILQLDTYHYYKVARCGSRTANVGGVRGNASICMASRRHHTYVVARVAGSQRIASHRITRLSRVRAAGRWEGLRSVGLGKGKPREGGVRARLDQNRLGFVHGPGDYGPVREFLAWKKKSILNSYRSQI